MNPNWPFLLLTAALLLIPSGIFCGPKVRFRPIRRDWHDHWSRILAHGFHAIDFGRAIVGGWWLTLALQPLADPGRPLWVLPVAQAALIIGAVVLQTLVCREPGTLNAPLAFLAGLPLGLYSPEVGGYALLAAAVLAAGARLPQAFFPLLSVLLVLFGGLFANFRQLPPLVIIGAVAPLLPWLWSMLFNRPLVIAYRAKRTDDPSAPVVTPKR